MSKTAHRRDDPGGPVPTRRRWPRRVFDVGNEPDPRFTFANERTFLAWIRTSLALLAAGIALEAFVENLSAGLRAGGAVALISVGIVSSIAAFFRWMANERAMRLGQPLPAPTLAVVLAYAVAGIGLLVGVAVLVRR